MDRQYRVVALVDGQLRIVGSPPYFAHGTATRVQSLWRNRLTKQGVANPYVRVQATDVNWSDL